MQRLAIGIFVVILLLPGVCLRVSAQGTPPRDPQAPASPNSSQPGEEPDGTPPPYGSATKMRHMKTMVKKELKKEVNKAIQQSAPPIEQWQPLTAGQKFRVFLKHTTSPYTFAGAAVN